MRPADRRFATAIVSELEARRHELPAPPLTLSFGGGTPSALPPADLARLVEAAGGGASEISLEINPEDLAPDPATAAAALRAGGFTRASAGVQSFDDETLRYLGRAHDGAGARAAVRALVAAGLSTGVDLIVGVPGEGAARLARDIEACAALGVQHVSAYLLTVEAGTPLVQLIADRKRAPVDDDRQAAAYEEVQARLVDAGYRQYEISSYARPGHESRHNRLYWGGGAYLGLGPSAHSMRRLDDGRVLRRHTRARFDAWVGDPLAAAHEVEELDREAAFREAVAFGLRDLLAGVSLAALAARHRARAGVVDEVRAALARAAADGDVTVRGERALLTPQGARFADRVARAVLA